MKFLGRKTKIIALCLSIAIVCSSVPCFAATSGLDNFKKMNSYAPNQFSDVKSSDWYSESIATVYELGLMKGNTNLTFNPDGKITNAEALTVAARLHKIYTTGNDDFSEIKAEMSKKYANSSNSDEVTFYNRWYSVYLYYLWNYVSYDHYYSYPYDDSLYTQGALVRCSVAEYLYYALPAEAYSQINTIPENSIPDAPFAEYSEVYALYRAGVLTGGDEVGTFTPMRSITRAELAAIISRAALPSLRKTFTLHTAKTETNHGVMVYENNMTISEKAELLVSVFEDGVNVTYECDSDILSLEWGEWNGWDIPLYITPLQNGEATIKIHITGNPSEYETISVTVTGVSEGNNNHPDPDASPISDPTNDSILPFSFERNSVNGIKVCWQAQNDSGKTINYYTIRVYFYNAVGDPAYDEITLLPYKDVKYVGPVSPGGELVIFHIVGYVPACSKIVLGDTILEYSDGTTEEFWYGWGTSYRR